MGCDMSARPQPADDLDAALLDEDAPTALPTAWTSDHVARRLVEAFRTLDRLPGPRGPREPGDHWPRHKVEWADHLAQAELPESERRERADWRNRVTARPSGAEITRMEAALDWLRDLRAADAGMALVTGLWAMRAARRRSVRGLCRERKWAPHTFYRVRAKALEHIAARLNARHQPVL
jgi:hypothetical protein